VLHLKHLRGRGVGEKVTGCDGKILKELEGPRGGGAWFARHGGIVPIQGNYYSILVPYINGYFKCFGCCGIADVCLDRGRETRESAVFLAQSGSNRVAQGLRIAKAKQTAPVAPLLARRRVL
jgi:hypothetical protein